MADSLFIQLHTLTSYPGALLNRDDAGFAKRLPFGGVSRTRVSSQCLKYHWRNFDGLNSLSELDIEGSIRSRETFRRLIVIPLVREGYPTPLVRAATFVLKEMLLSGKAPSKNEVRKLLEPAAEQDADDALNTHQITVFGHPEVRYLRQLVADTITNIHNDLPVFWSNDQDPEEEAISKALDALIDFSTKDLKKNLRGLKTASGLDAALFGRMATSDLLARGDAALHVAHSFTTHEEESESDYFSAVDELRRDQPGESGELGAGHINTQELTSGLFYGYVVIDVPLLVSNIEGVPRHEWRKADKAVPAEVIRRLVHLVTTVSPGAKLGSTAPHSYAQLVLGEVGEAQPRTLANAFHKAVRGRGAGILVNSCMALAEHVAGLDRMYGKLTERRLSTLQTSDDLVKNLGVEEVTSVPSIATWAAERVGVA